MVKKLALTLVIASAYACKPELEGRPSRVESERILAVRSEPAAAAPGADVHYDTLYVGPDGELSGDDLDWGICNVRKALAESGTISGKCLFLEAPGLDLLGTGSGVDASVPRDACETFGPTPPTPKPGEPNLRPVDPDPTGGYYQPVRVLARGDEQEYAVGVTRLACGLGGATQEQSADYNRRYRPNENPQLDALGLLRADGLEVMLSDGDAEPLSVEAGERVLFRASWALCPDDPSCGDGICSPGESDCPDDCNDPHGCTGAEPYVYFDPGQRSIDDRREAIRISWFANAGSFDHERTGRGADEVEQTSSDNQWVAPQQSGDVLLWVVIRDDRGGVGWRSYRLQVD